MEYLYDEYGTLILEALAATFTMIFVIGLFVVFSEPDSSHTTPIIYSTISQFIKTLVGSI